MSSLKRQKTATQLPKVLFGTSSLGNLFSEPTHEEKKAVIEQILASNPAPVFDSAGKYGAGLALEELGKCLEELGVEPGKVLISNKLAWKRVPLTTPEPTFEPGAWVNLKNDAVQAISYDGIMECYKQGNELLGRYDAQIISVHDPDEYLASAKDAEQLQAFKEDVLGAYRALAELKKAGKVQSIGVGAKDISVVDFISDHFQLDWAMFACSITPYTHSAYARGLLTKLGKQGVDVINSAVFNAGFLIGSDNFDYAKITRELHPEKFTWRDRFNALCDEYGVKPAEACVQFSFLFPEIISVALNTTKPSRVQSNVALTEAVVPNSFWTRLRDEGLLTFSPAATLRHTVLFKFVEGATAAQKASLVEALRGIPRKIPQIVKLSCGCDEALATGNFDFSLTIDFLSAADYEVYATHPAHKEVVQNYIKPIILPGSRSACQFPL